jgi:hypothetical protein
MCRRLLFAISAVSWLAAVAAAAEPVMPAAPTVLPLGSPDGPSPCAPPCEAPCGPPGSFWATAEFLYWHVRGDNAPPLVTTSPAGTPLSSAGVLGSRGTAVLVGGRLEDDSFPGLRVGAGFWLDDGRTLGLEAGGLFLFSETKQRRLSSPGSPLLARPFFNTGLGRPDAELIAFPGVVAGSVAVGSSFTFEGVEGNFRYNLCCGGPCDGAGAASGGRLDALAGVRCLRLHEDLDVVEDLTVTGNSTGLTPGTRSVVRDAFRTEDFFYGGQVGLSGRLWWGPLSLGVTGKVGVGWTHKVVTIAGLTASAVPDGPAVAQTGGLLALPSNSGRFASDELTVISELDVEVGYQVTSWLRVFVGYGLLYWPQVVRPGGQIDPRLNVAQLPPSTGPVAGPPFATGRDTTLLLQGATAGLELRW